MKVSKELREITQHYAQKMNFVTQDQWQAKPHTDKWSKKEVIGHLIDSAHNNLRRFIAGQYESSPPHIIYDQDFWVKANHYQQSDDDLISLWKSLNLRIATIIEAMPPECYNQLVNTGKENPKLHPLLWLAEDYVKHMKHHLNQIFPGDFKITYP